MKAIFNSKIFKLQTNALKENFERDGYVFIKQALSSDFLKIIKKDIYNYRNNFNNNRVGGVSLKTQYYNTFLLSISEVFFKYCTSDFVLNLSEKLLSRKDFRLKALRYYETKSHHKMQWHTDTKTPEGFKRIPGLIFIVYVSQVPEGEFQYIKGSHKWSQKKLFNDFDENFINKNFYSEIESFKGSAGDLIIYDTAGIHRAKPFFNKRFTRSSLFFQIDCENDSEPIYINPSFINPSDQRVLTFLGFGQKSTYKEFPVSMAHSAPTSLLFKKVILPKMKTIIVKIIKTVFLLKFFRKFARKYLYPKN